MIDIKGIVRSIIKEEVSRLFEIRTGTVYEKHFNDREYDRLKSEYSTFTEEFPEVKKRVFDNIAFLKKITFVGQDNIGVIVLKSSKKYVYHQVVGNKIEHSEGNFVWVVIRGNDLDTVVFGDAMYIPRNTQIRLTIDRLRDYIINEKNGNFVITEKDLRKLQNKQVVQQAEKPKENVVVIDGVKWVVDDVSEKIYKKNNSEIKYDVYDFIENMGEKVQDEILSFLVK